MANPEIVEHLSDGLRRGEELENIREQLLFRGYADYDINQAIEEISPEEEKDKKGSHSKEKVEDGSIEGWDEVLE